MRPLIASLALFVFLGASARAAEPYFKRVWPEWHAGDDFQSLYEDRTGKEIMGQWTVLRSHPENRTGLYFVTRVENPGAPIAGATFVVRMISPDSQVTKVFTFAADIPERSHLFVIGLTGKDWAGPRVEPVAWDVELHANDGTLVCRKVSYLWEKPDR
jgi:hypothetical protein